jgi:uncharacterized protein (TIGR02118 family)
MPKLIVMYPKPLDVDAFDKAYTEEHIPLLAEKLPMARLTTTRIIGAPRGEPPFYRIAELHFDTLDDLQAAASSEGGRATARHAFSLSTGGPVIFMIGEDE